MAQVGVVRANAGAAAVHDGNIRGMNQTLDQAIGQLEDVVETLAEKLDPLLLSQPTPLNAKPESMEPQPDHSPVLAQLLDLRNRTHRLRERLASITSRLEV